MIVEEGGVDGAVEGGAGEGGAGEGRGGAKALASAALALVFQNSSTLGA